MTFSFHSAQHLTATDDNWEFAIAYQMAPHAYYTQVIGEGGLNNFKELGYNQDNKEDSKCI